MNIDTPQNAVFTLNDEIGFVALIDSTGNDAGIVNAARVSFGKQVESISDRDKKLIKFLLEHQHGTPFEHNIFTFHIKCPLFIARQWMRHRIASYNEISYRYVEAPEEFYIPKEFRMQSQNNRQASVQGDFDDDTQDKSLQLYKQSVQHSFDSYKQLIESGVAREQARAVLPLTTYTQFYFTCNLRALLHFIELRIHKDAQWEIQQYAKALLDIAETKFPDTIKIWQEIDH